MKKIFCTRYFKKEELATLINTIGAGFGADFKVEDSHYDKVYDYDRCWYWWCTYSNIIINFLLSIYEGFDYSRKSLYCTSTTYKVSKKSGKKEEVIYCWEDYELEDAKKKIGRGYNVQRYKGLGEMNASQLWETTMDPETRLDSSFNWCAAVVERNVTVLMGDKVDQDVSDWTKCTIYIRR